MLNDDPRTGAATPHAHHHMTRVHNCRHLARIDITRTRVRRTRMTRVHERRSLMMRQRHYPQPRS